MEMRFCAKGVSPIEYFENINKWLRDNSGIRPLRLCVGEFVKEENPDAQVYECTLIYDENGCKNVTYALSYYHKISGVKIGLDVMKSFWQEANPHAKIALCSYCHTVNRLAEAAYDIDGAVVANCNCMWIIYEKCDGILEFTPADFYHTNEQKENSVPEVKTDAVAEEITKETLESVPIAEVAPPVQPAPKGRFCAFCGKLNSAGAVFCAFCGQKMKN